MAQDLRYGVALFDLGSQGSRSDPSESTDEGSCVSKVMSSPAKWVWVRLAKGSIPLLARSEMWALPYVIAWALACVLVHDTGWTYLRGYCLREYAMTLLLFIYLTVFRSVTMHRHG